MGVTGRINSSWRCPATRQPCDTPRGYHFAARAVKMEHGLLPTMRLRWRLRPTESWNISSSRRRLAAREVELRLGGPPCSQLPPKESRRESWSDPRIPLPGPSPEPLFCAEHGQALRDPIPTCCSAGVRRSLPLVQRGGERGPAASPHVPAFLPGYGRPDPVIHEGHRRRRRCRCHPSPRSQQRGVSKPHLRDEVEGRDPSGRRTAVATGRP